LRIAGLPELRTRDRRIALMGGAFDPIHVGHLWICQEAVRICALDRVFLLPSYDPPHKASCSAPFSDRLRMLQTALNTVTAPEQALVSPCDIERGLGGPSYSFRTAEAVREVWGQDKWLAFILGTDSLAELHTWRNVERFVELCDALLVATRPGHPSHCPVESAREKLIPVGEVPFAVSSTKIRERLKRGYPIRYMVPGSVEDYIQRKGLYAGYHRER